MSAPRDELESAPAPHPSRAAWLLGLLLLGTLIAVVSHRSEERELLALARRSRPLWLLAAVALQALTYVCAGAVWQRALARTGAPQTLRSLVPLGLAKLFTDQALPSAGLSGSLLVMRSLVRRGIPRPIAIGALVTGVFGYFASNAIAALLALAALARRGEAGALVWSVASAACFVSALVPTLILVLRSAAARWLPERVRGFARVHSVLAALAEAPRDPILRSRSGAEVTALQLAIVALDAMTLLVCVRALGATIAPEVAFAAFVIASAIASLAWVPGGIGTFEAACVALLSVHGLSLESALASTLLLRGLTFWLPMLPGSWLAQRESRGAAAPRELPSA